MSELTEIINADVHKHAERQREREVNLLEGMHAGWIINHSMAAEGEERDSDAHL